MKPTFSSRLTPLAAFVFFLNATSFIYAESKAKIDIGPAYIHLDILESGKTVDRMDMAGVRADASYLFSSGICLKPTLLYGSNKGCLFTTSISLGQYIPLNEEWSFMPAFGVSYNYLRTSIDLPALSLENLKERFRSISPFLSLDAYYSFNSTLRLSGSFQYAWSRTHTDIQHLGKSKSDCKGPNYSLLLEKDISPSLSVNLGMGYNISLTKEKHGLRGTGVKLGIARWY